MDLTKINLLVEQLRQLAIIIVKLAVPLAVILVVVDVIFGTNMGVMMRLGAAFGITAKEALAYIAAGAIAWALWQGVKK